MVFHLFERFFGTWGSPKDFFKRHDRSRIDYLMQNGFTEEEAKNIAWFESVQSKGKIYGVLGGLFTVYATRSWFATLQGTYPRFRHQPYWIGISRIGIIYLGYALGDYFATSSWRKGSNDIYSNLWKNTQYLLTREKFGQEYQPMNRRWTEEEIAHFHLNEMNQKMKRKWIYNPAIHGDDQEEWENTVKLLERSDIHKDAKVQEQIKLQNKAKIDAGEQITQEPWKIESAIDRTGVAQKVAKFSFFTNWKGLY